MLIRFNCFNECLSPSASPNVANDLCNFFATFNYCEYDLLPMFHIDEKSNKTEVRDYDHLIQLIGYPI
uniref:Uncharacterized protein n=1 Tax=Parascaris univalens TaxID=6257 RepID=A0A915ASY1_PARUN